MRWSHRAMRSPFNIFWKWIQYYFGLHVIDFSMVFGKSVGYNIIVPYWVCKFRFYRTAIISENLSAPCNNSYPYRFNTSNMINVAINRLILSFGYDGNVIESITSRKRNPDISAIESNEMVFILWIRFLVIFIKDDRLKSDFNECEISDK